MISKPSQHRFQPATDTPEHPQNTPAGLPPVRSWFAETRAVH